MTKSTEQALIMGYCNMAGLSTALELKQKLDEPVQCAEIITPFVSVLDVRRKMRLEDIDGGVDQIYRGGIRVRVLP